MSAVTRRSYAGGNFELRLDGRDTTSYIKSIEGGWSRAELNAGKTVGPWQLKQISTIVVDPITVEMGVMTPGVLKWIQRSWNASDHQTCNGQVSYADFNMKTQFVHEFTGALLTKVTFPTLDGSSKDGGYMTCELQPEQVSTRSLPTPGRTIGCADNPYQKWWTPSAFRLNIDGIEDMQYANRIDAFTVTLQFKRVPAGAFRFTELVPVSLAFPNITGSISLRYAESLIKWHDDYIRNANGAGITDARARRNGSIEFLSTDRKRSLFEVKLTEVGPLKLSLAKSSAGDTSVKRLNFELFVRKMAIEGSPELGFS